MRSTLFTVASIALLSTLGLTVPETQAKSLSNRNVDHSPLVAAAAPQRRSTCNKRSKKSKKSAKKAQPVHHSTSSRKPSYTPVQAAAVKHTTSTKTSSTHTSTHTTSSSTSRAAAPTSSTSTSSAASSSPTTSAGSSPSTGLTPASYAGAAPPNSPWGNCFDLTATAFQPNWKGEATTTWCGVNFDRSSPIIALPLADLSKAYGSNTAVTYYSNEALWKQMVSDWCGREVWIQGPGGLFKAYFGDANLWTSVDNNMGLYEKLKGVPVGTYADPDAAGWINGVKGCFTGSQISIKNGYPMSYS